jgi:uncharacterized membrane protein YeaQ/YmgE (transglycosylase-associated protein family)
MNVAVVVLWALVGWCGTPWPRPPIPGPLPPRGPWISKLIGVVGGVVGGWIFNQVWTVEGAWTGIDAAATAIGAWVGAVFLIQLFAIGSWPTPEKPGA